MDVASARHALADVRLAQARTRRRLQAFWFPLCCYGGYMALAGLAGIALGPDVLSWAALLGALGLAVLISAFFRRRARKVGLDSGGRRYWITSAVGVAGCVIASSLLTTRPLEVAPWLAVAGIYQVFAWLQHSWDIAAMGLAMALLAALFWSAVPNALPGVLTSLEGALMLAVGVAWRRVQRQ